MITGGANQPAFFHGCQNRKVGKEFGVAKWKEVDMAIFVHIFEISREIGYN